VTAVLAEPPVLASGAELAPGYEVVAHLSRGRTLDVYDLWSTARACRCVGKALRPDCAEDASARMRLQREGALLTRLAHPHLVRAYEIVGGVVILETLPGETLSHLIRTRSRRLPTADLAWFGLHLCSALHYLHGEGWLHLDLKPSNIVCDGGHAKLIDLSLARRPGPVASGVGTAQYLSPEQARGATVGPAADVWGIGAVLFTAATGQRPFGVGTPPEQLRRRAARVGELRRLPAPLGAAIDACLEPEADARPSVAGLAEALEPFAA
jgi:eukaryotic-like serine/threonine-protein kinase